QGVIHAANVEFGGVYDGGGYSITDVVIYGSGSNVGLFGSLNGATVSDLVLRRINVVSTAANTGVLAGSAVNSAISSVTITGIVNGRNVHSLGMMIGAVNDCAVNDCSVSGYLYAVGNNAQVGGLTGTFIESSTPAGTVELRDSIAFVDIVVESDSQNNVGSLVGRLGSEHTSGNTYLTNSAMIKVNTTIYQTSGTGQGTGKTFADFKTWTGTAPEFLFSIMVEDIMRSYILLPHGTTPTTVAIGNYRQLILLVAYPWLDYTLSSHVYVPEDSLFGSVVYHGFYGSYSENGYKIYSDQVYQYVLLPNTQVIVYEKGSVS
ncbi:MAG: hypothetical protein J5755_00660, partial [Clostridia bacterium]|nr:hypothetical protein [Clostridia bacterium]